MGHRVKNLLAIASGLTEITARTSKSAPEMAKALSQRLIALGRAHDLTRPVPGGDVDGALLGDLLSVLLAPYDDDGAFSGRVRVAVPRMRVSERAATTLALVIHELATNSLKYGALSTESGTLDLSQRIEAEGFVLLWTERGGPPVVAPEGAGGFGSTLIKRSMTGQLGGSIEYDWSSEGVVIALCIDPARLAGCGACVVPEAARAGTHHSKAGVPDPALFASCDPLDGMTRPASDLGCKRPVHESSRLQGPRPQSV